MSDAATPLEIFVETFHRHRVDFMIIGGQAALLHGSPNVTYDTDLCYRRTEENLQRLADALHELKPTLRGAPQDLPFRLDARSLALGANFTFETTQGPLDLLGWVEPIGTYDDLIDNAEFYDINGIPTATIALDDLIRIKQHIRRQKDVAALDELLAIRDERSKAHGGESA
ncbi:MAG: hypothetical protein ACF8R7_08515 [Phycisphaerales bacterium JB039]